MKVSSQAFDLNPVNKGQLRSITDILALYPYAVRPMTTRNAYPHKDGACYQAPYRAMCVEDYHRCSRTKLNEKGLKTAIDERQ